jgi:hypothetical protein
MERSPESWAIESQKEGIMHSTLFAVVTLAWLLLQGFVGARLLMPKGRPYKVPIAALHVVLFLPIAGGWFSTVAQLAKESGPHLGSWISESAMGIAVVWMLVVGIILVSGRKAPAPKAFTNAHRLGMMVIAPASIAGIICMLVGV